MSFSQSSWRSVLVDESGDESTPRREGARAAVGGAAGGETRQQRRQQRQPRPQPRQPRRDAEEPGRLAYAGAVAANLPPSAAAAAVTGAAPPSSEPRERGPRRVQTQAQLQAQAQAQLQAEAEARAQALAQALAQAQASPLLRGYASALMRTAPTSPRPPASEPKQPDEEKEEEKEKVPKLPTCEICSDEGAYLLDCVQRDYERRIAKTYCEHKTCRDCLRAWIEACLAQQIKTIRCPFDGCPATLYGDDIRRVSVQLHNEYRKLQSADFRGRFFSLDKSEPELKEMIARGELCACPRCGMVAARYDGCNSMTCTCGTQFCYGCNSEQCGCMFKSFGWSPEKGFECVHCHRKNFLGGYHCYACRESRFPYASRETAMQNPETAATLIDLPDEEVARYKRHQAKKMREQSAPVAGAAPSGGDAVDWRETRRLEASSGGSDSNSRGRGRGGRGGRGRGARGGRDDRGDRDRAGRASREEGMRGGRGRSRGGETGARGGRRGRASEEPAVTLSSWIESAIGTRLSLRGEAQREEDEEQQRRRRAEEEEGWTLISQRQPQRTVASLS